MKVLSLASIFLLATACSTPGPPEAPQFETASARECANDCRDAYDGRLKYCGGFQSGAGTVEDQRRGCVSEADNTLRKCYESCEQGN